jgi:hypothetical protein
MNITGYGEDFLTLWALTRKTKEVLTQLEDYTNPEQCKLIYRPSFGRAGGSMKDQRAEFGEFDSILLADKNAYLIESKWDGNGQRKHRVNLDKTQVKRHKVFTWYIDNWVDGTDWDQFIADKSKEFTQRFPENKIAPTSSILKKNLVEVMSQVGKKTLHNVLMYFYCNEPQELRLDYPDVIFKKAVLRYPNDKNFLGFLI